MSTYVYLAQSGTRPDWYAIGKSKNVEKRIEGLNHEITGLEWEPVAAIESDDPGALRSALLRRYQDRRLPSHNGWFSLTPEDVEYFETLATEGE